MSINKYATAECTSGELSGGARREGAEPEIQDVTVELNTGFNGAILTKKKFDAFVAEINDLCQEAIT